MPSYVSPKSNWLIEEVLKKKKKKKKTPGESPISKVVVLYKLFLSCRFMASASHILFSGGLIFWFFVVLYREFSYH